VQVSAPGAQVSARSVQVVARSPQVSAPGAQVSARSVQVSARSVQVSARSVQVSARSVQVETAGYMDKARLRGRNEPAQAGCVCVARALTRRLGCVSRTAHNRAARPASGAAVRLSDNMVSYSHAPCAKQ
jgi:hypothetical protein